MTVREHTSGQTAGGGFALAIHGGWSPGPAADLTPVPLEQVGKMCTIRVAGPDRWAGPGRPTTDVGEVTHGGQEHDWLETAGGARVAGLRVEQLADRADLKKDMIIRGGENISPREIEEFLLRREGVRDIQVAGVASPKYGEEEGAFVITKDGAAITEEDVQDFCRGKIANFKVPRYVFFVDTDPMTASGKIQTYKLRELGVKLLRERGVEPS